MSESYIQEDEMNYSNELQDVDRNTIKSHVFHAFKAILLDYADKNKITLKSIVKHVIDKMNELYGSNSLNTITFRIDFVKSLLNESYLKMFGITIQRRLYKKPFWIRFPSREVLLEHINTIADTPEIIYSDDDAEYDSERDDIVSYKANSNAESDSDPYDLSYSTNELPKKRKNAKRKRTDSSQPISKRRRSNNDSDVSSKSKSSNGIPYTIDLVDMDESESVNVMNQQSGISDSSVDQEREPTSSISLPAPIASDTTPDTPIPTTVPYTSLHVPTTISHISNTSPHTSIPTTIPNTSLPTPSPIPKSSTTRYTLIPQTTPEQQNILDGVHKLIPQNTPAQQNILDGVQKLIKENKVLKEENQLKTQENKTKTEFNEKLQAEYHGLNAAHEKMQMDHTLLNIAYEKLRKQYDELNAVNEKLKRDILQLHKPINYGNRSGVTSTKTVSESPTIKSPSSLVGAPNPVVGSLNPVVNGILRLINGHPQTCSIINFSSAAVCNITCAKIKYDSTYNAFCIIACKDTYANTVISLKVMVNKIAINETDWVTLINGDVVTIGGSTFRFEKITPEKI